MNAHTAADALIDNSEMHDNSPMGFAHARQSLFSEIPSPAEARVS